MTKNLAPIILFCFNRVDHTSKTIKALQENSLAQESDLFIFCDGPRKQSEIEKVKEVHELIDNVQGFKSVSVTKQELNLGLANSVISSITKIIDKYNKVIVIEDDIVTSSNFLEFMNQSLDFYENEEGVFSVTGFNYNNYKKPENFKEDFFYVQGRTSSWGWATWKNRWDKIDFEIKDFTSIKNNKDAQKEFNKSGSNLYLMLKDQVEGKVDTWDIQFSYHMFKEKKVCIFPVETFVKNIGFDSSGIHCHSDSSVSDFDLKTPKAIKLKLVQDIENNESASREYVKLTTDQKTFWQKTTSKKRLSKIKSILLGLIIGFFLGYFLKF